MPVFSLASPNTPASLHSPKRNAVNSGKAKPAAKKAQAVHATWYKLAKMRWQWEQYTNSLEFE